MNRTKAEGDQNVRQNALAERFSICLQLVGDEFFRAMTQCYVRERLPRTPMLFEYGDAFATFVSNFEPARELAYLPDVARLEYAVGAAYHAADAAPLPLDFLRALPYERLDYDPLLSDRPLPAHRRRASFLRLRSDKD
ncbi:HvfC/BufC family peptide modification chaperone [Methylocystis sp.]|uniref:HvfC/BufC family peptide modification chaperone n=1 Tax=Methylocystis sp. TaxID=1911079 RepID=UPI003DA54497